jgi:large subunit ribosomal protein L3
MRGGPPTLLGFPAVKVGTMHSITVDDREKTPNFGKPLYNPTSVLAVPEASVIGVRLYSKENGAERAIGETYSSSLPKGLDNKSGVPPEKFVDAWKDKIAHVVRVVALVALLPREAGLTQKKPVVFEVGVGGGDDVAGQLNYAIGLVGKPVKFADIFKAGSYVDVIGVTKGKGYEGPVTRFGVKRKQHKSRKSVRAVGVIGPWHPAAVTYTTARAGQMGFHQRTETGKRIIAIGNPKDVPINRPGGFMHFGDVTSDYALLRGTVPGSTRRIVVVRHPVRMVQGKTTPQQILELSTRAGR